MSRPHRGSVAKRRVPLHPPPRSASGAGEGDRAKRGGGGFLREATLLRATAMRAALGGRRLAAVGRRRALKRRERERRFPVYQGKYQGI
jgi:hypothetical protein